MTDNYNDDYREVIPEEEKTETTLRESRDNEKIARIRRSWILWVKIPLRKRQRTKGQQRI